MNIEKVIEASRYFCEPALPENFTEWGKDYAYAWLEVYSTKVYENHSGAYVWKQIIELAEILPN